MLSLVSTGMGDHFWVGISVPPRYATKRTRSTRLCIPSGCLNRVPTSIGWGKGEDVTAAGLQVKL